MHTNHQNSPYITIRGYTEEEVDSRVSEHVKSGKMEVVGKRKYFQENTGVMWYVKLKRIL